MTLSQKVKVPTLFQSENYPSNNFHLEGVWSRGMARWLFIGNQVNFPSHLRACCIGMKKIQIQKKIPRQIQLQKEKILWRLFIGNQVNPPEGLLHHKYKYKCKNKHQDKYNDREKEKEPRRQPSKFLSHPIIWVSGSILRSTNLFWAISFIG